MKKYLLFLAMFASPCFAETYKEFSIYAPQAHHTMVPKRSLPMLECAATKPDMPTPEVLHSKICEGVKNDGKVIGGYNYTGDGLMYCAYIDATDWSIGKFAILFRDIDTCKKFQAELHENVNVYPAKKLTETQMTEIVMELIKSFKAPK